MKTSFIALLVLPSLILGCKQFDPIRSTAGSYRNYTQVNAEIQEGVLYDPHDRFSIKVPKLLKPGARISGQLEKDMGTVQFTDDLGTLIRVDIFTAISPKAQARVSNWDSETIFSDNRRYMLELCRAAVPKAEIVHQEILQLDDRKIDFFIFTMPEGAMATNVKTKKRLDALRGSFSTHKGNSILTLTTQRTLGLWIPNEKVLDGRGDLNPQAIKSMKERLTALVETVSIN